MTVFFQLRTENVRDKYTRFPYRGGNMLPTIGLGGKICFQRSKN